jgi:ribosomal 30S subunit maturation factor RimM
MANKNECVKIFEIAPDDPFITNKKGLDVLFARAAEQLECNEKDLFWATDVVGFKTLKVQYEHIGTVKPLSQREIKERLILLEGFIWGLTYDLRLE